jgi:WD40 repeat protein
VPAPTGDAANGWADGEAAAEEAFLQRLRDDAEHNLKMSGSGTREGFTSRGPVTGRTVAGLSTSAACSLLNAISRETFIPLLAEILFEVWMRKHFAGLLEHALSTATIQGDVTAASAGLLVHSRSVDALDPWRLGAIVDAIAEGAETEPRPLRDSIIAARGVERQLRTRCASVDAPSRMPVPHFPMMRLAASPKLSLWLALITLEPACEVWQLDDTSSPEVLVAAATVRWSRLPKYEECWAAATLAFERADINETAVVSWSDFTEYLIEHVTTAAALSKAQQHTTETGPSQSSGFFYRVMRLQQELGDEEVKAILPISEAVRPATGSDGNQARLVDAASEYGHVIVQVTKTRCRLVNAASMSVLVTLDHAPTLAVVCIPTSPAVFDAVGERRQATAKQQETSRSKAPRDKSADSHEGWIGRTVRRSRASIEAGRSVPEVLALVSNDLHLRLYRTSDKPVPLLSDLGAEHAKVDSARGRGARSALVVRSFASVRCQSTPTAVAVVRDAPDANAATALSPADPGARLYLGDGHGNITVLDANSLLFPRATFESALMGRAKIHAKGVTAVVYVRHQDALLTASLDGYLSLTDANTLSVSRRFLAHASGVKVLRYSAEHNVAITLGFGKAATVWAGVGSGRRFTLFDGRTPHMTLLVALHLAPSLGQVITIDADGIMKVWSLVHYGCLQTCSLAVSASDPVVADGDADDDTAATSAVQHHRRRVNLRDSQSIVESIMGFVAPDMSVAVVRTSVFAECYGKVFAVGHRNAVAAKFTTTKQLVRAHATNVVAVAASAVANVVVTCTARQVSIWDLSRGQLLCTTDVVVEAFGEAALSNDGPPLHLTTVCCDGMRGAKAFVGFSDGSVIAIRLVTGRVLKRFGMSPEDRHQATATLPPGVTLAVVCVGYEESAASRLICALHADNSLRLYRDDGDARLPTSTLRLGTQSGVHICAAHSAALNLFAAGNSLGRIDVLSTETVTGALAHAATATQDLMAMMFLGSYPAIAVADARGDIAIRQVSAGHHMESSVLSNDPPVIAVVEHWEPATHLAFCATACVLFVGDAKGCVAAYHLGGVVHAHAHAGMRPCSLLRRFHRSATAALLATGAEVDWYLSEEAAAALLHEEAANKGPLPHLATKIDESQPWLASPDDIESAYADLGLGATLQKRKPPAHGGKAHLVGVLADKYHSTLTRDRSDYGHVTALAVLEYPAAAQAASVGLGSNADRAVPASWGVVVVGYSRGTVLLTTLDLSVVVAELVDSFTPIGMPNAAGRPPVAANLATEWEHASREIAFLCMLQQFLNRRRSAARSVKRRESIFNLTATMTTGTLTQFSSGLTFYNAWSPSDAEIEAWRRVSAYTRISSYCRNRSQRQQATTERRRTLRQRRETLREATTRLEGATAEAERVRRGSLFRPETQHRSPSAEGDSAAGWGTQLEELLRNMSRPTSALSSDISRRPSFARPDVEALLSTTRSRQASGQAFLPNAPQNDGRNSVEEDTRPTGDAPSPAVPLAALPELNVTMLNGTATAATTPNGAETATPRAIRRGGLACHRNRLGKWASIAAFATTTLASAIVPEKSTNLAVRQDNSADYHAKASVFGSAPDITPRKQEGRARPDFVGEVKRTRVVVMDVHDAAEAVRSEPVLETMAATVDFANTLVSTMTYSPIRPPRNKAKPRAPMPRGTGEVVRPHSLFAHPQLLSATPVAAPVGELPCRSLLTTDDAPTQHAVAAASDAHPCATAEARQRTASPTTSETSDDAADVMEQQTAVPMLEPHPPPKVHVPVPQAREPEAPRKPPLTAMHRRLVASLNRQRAGSAAQPAPPVPASNQMARRMAQEMAAQRPRTTTWREI